MNTRQQQEIVKASDAPLAVRTLREDLHKMEPQFKYALPPHIPVERFIRVIMTAVQRNPKLLKCTRESFFNACMSCAQDGLLPDGREAALVPYGESEDGRKGADVAQYLPMIQGIRKKVRNAGVLSDWNVQCVQEGDEFNYQLGDDPFIHHVPAKTGGRARKVLFAYSIATYPDGTKSREVMNADQLRDIQSKSKAKRGPWSDPIFYPEMCRKTVAKLHAKQLPQSTDLDTLMRRDDALYDFEGKKTPKIEPPHRPTSVAAALDAFGSEPVIEEGSRTSLVPTPAEDEQSGGETEEKSPATIYADTDSPAAQPSAPASAAPNQFTVEAAYQRGKEARGKGILRRALPGEYRDAAHSALADAWERGWDEAGGGKRLV